MNDIPAAIQERSTKVDEDDAREAMIEVLTQGGIDYDASEKDTVVVETDRPNVFVEFRFGDPGRLEAVRIVDWSTMRNA